MKLLKTKHFRRLAVFLAMIAPAVYLFGSLFCGLTGAHGTMPFGENYSENSYLSVMRNDVDVSAGTGYESSSPNWASSNRLAYVFSDNMSVKVQNDFNGASAMNVMFYQDDVFVSAIRNIPVDYSGFFTFVPLNNANQFLFNVSKSPSVSLGVFDYSFVYYHEYTAESNSAYIFGQFFAKDNFLVQWGRNAISENPYGFAPFGAFWRYLDVNVLHLSNDQMGLMGYGYMYYACHVLLFDVGFILVTFFLDFIQRIADKFTGGE